MAHPGDAGDGARGDSGSLPHLETAMPHRPRPFSPWAYLSRDVARAASAVLPALTMLLCTAPAAAGCWVDEPPAKSNDQRPLTAPAVAPMDRLAREINAVLHRHPVLAALPDGPTPVRLRTRWSIGYPHPVLARRSLWLQLREHRSELWGTGPCGLSPNAERIEPRASIVVHVDAPEQLLERRAIYDDELTAWSEPAPTGQAGTHKVYEGRLVVLSSSGRPPWTPVSMDEYLRFHERELKRGADANAKSRRDIDGVDDAAMQRQMQAIYENMRKIDPAAAEKLLSELRAQMPAARAAAQRNVQTSERQDAERLEALRAFRASLPPAVLQGQARLGWTEPREPDVLQRMPRLVKLDAAWAGDPASHGVGPRLIGLNIQGKEPFEAPMLQVLQTLDYAALVSLLAPAGRSAP
jgi:hypothetical protein